MPSSFKALLCAAAIAIGFTASAQGQDQTEAATDAILILDASGSMWGQIDGINKIVIAKDTVETLVRSLPDDQRLGMVAYGHRKKGDCNDIETIADVGADRDAVIKEIRALSPKGKTPLSKSVEHAATALNYKKNAATVILVSDGLETCDADPCALARLLEENGLDFTVHVVGFDVTQEERKGLACIAEETGGQFLAADNADELTDALAQVAITEAAPTDEPETQPKPQTVALKATMLRGGPDIQSQLNWTVTPKDGGDPVFQKDNAGYVDFEVVPGDYVAKAVWTGWPHKGERVGGDKIGTKEFTIVAARPAVVTVPIDLGIPVTLEADPSVPEGGQVRVRWSGPDDLGAFVSTNKMDDSPRDYIYSVIAQRGRDAFETEAAENRAIDTNGDGKFDQDDMAEALVGAPSYDGEYEVRYVLNDPRLILARMPLTVTDGNYSVSAPTQVGAAEKFMVQWSGALTPGDFITIEKVGTAKPFTPKGNLPRLTEDGAPIELTAYAEPGQYEVRYVLANGYTLYGGMQHVVQATAPIEIVAVEADVEGPAEVIGGSTVTFDVRPAGDSWQDDYVSIVTPGATKYSRDSWLSLGRQKDNPGEQATFQMPAIAGDYEIAYFLAPGDTVLARKPIRVVQAQATVDAPDSVKAGEAFDVSYTGDGFHGDRIIICPADTPDDRMWQWGLNYGFAAKPDETVGTYSEAQSKRRLVGQAGAYEARYVTGKQNVVIARDAFTVVD